jgi:hypothetical protein
MKNTGSSIDTEYARIAVLEQKNNDMKAKIDYKKDSKMIGNHSRKNTIVT